MLLIILPSILSGLGMAFVVTGIVVDHGVLRAIFLSLGLLMLWLDVFLTMALMRRWLRTLDSRLRRIEGALTGNEDSGGR